MQPAQMHILQAVNGQRRRIGALATGSVGLAFDESRERRLLKIAGRAAAGACVGDFHPARPPLASF